MKFEPSKLHSAIPKFEFYFYNSNICRGIFFLYHPPQKRHIHLSFNNPSNHDDCSQCICFKHRANQHTRELQLAVFKRVCWGEAGQYIGMLMRYCQDVLWMGNDNCSHWVMWCNFLNIWHILMLQKSIESLSYVDYDHHPLTMKLRSFICFYPLKLRMSFRGEFYIFSHNYR